MVDSAAGKRVTSKQVECPTCAAQPGEPCRGSAYSGRSHRSVQSHHLRIDAARKANIEPPRIREGAKRLRDKWVKR